MALHEETASLMAKIMYQSRPSRTTTMGACRTCRCPSPGGMECARCLTDELGRVIENHGAAIRWLDSFLKVQQDEAQVLLCASRAMRRTSG